MENEIAERRFLHEVSNQLILLRRVISDDCFNMHPVFAILSSGPLLTIVAISTIELLAAAAPFFWHVCATGSALFNF